MDAQEIRAALDNVGDAYMRVLQENALLKQELLEMRQCVPLRPQQPLLEKRAQSEQCAAPILLQVTSDTISPAAQAERQGSKDEPFKVVQANFDADERILVDEKRNNERARLQTLIAEFDPEESGDWAKDQACAKSILKMLKEDPDIHFDPDQDAIQLVVDIFLEWCEANDSQPTWIQFVNLTSTTTLEEIFGLEKVGFVMLMQDSILRSLMNEIIAFSGMQGIRRSIKLDPLRAMFTPRLMMGLLKQSDRLELTEWLGTALVVINTLMLGVSVDVEPTWRGWDYISALFCVLFMMEIIARIGFSGGVRRFLSGKNRGWNAFDTVLVAVAQLDLVMLIVITWQQHIDPRFMRLLRMLRLLRLTRVARLARTGVFHELAYMIRGIEAGTTVLLWAIFLLLCICYIGAVFLTQTIGRDTDVAEFRTYGRAHFGSVVTSMSTLFSCFTGDCYAFDGRPLSYILFKRYGSLMVAVYWSCLLLVTFGLCNVIIANFVQNTQRAARFNDGERRRILKKERLMVQHKTSLLLRRIQQVISARSRSNAIVEVADITISRDMWRHLIEDKEILHWLEDMGCDDTLRRKLFDKIDRDGNGSLECNELVTGIVDLLRGRFDNFEQVTQILRSIHHRMVQMEAALSLRQQHMTSSTAEKTQFL